MSAIPKTELIREMTAMGERLSELAKTFSGDVHLSVGAFSGGHIRLACSVFEDDGLNAKVVGMPIRRYYSTVNQRWEEDEEDAYPEVHKAPED